MIIITDSIPVFDEGTELRNIASQPPLTQVEDGQSLNALLTTYVSLARGVVFRSVYLSMEIQYVKERNNNTATTTKQGQERTIPC